MSKKRHFFLKGFSTEEIDKKYGLSIISNIDKDVVPSNKTNISDVIDKSEEKPVSFIDEKNDKCLITMLDVINREHFPSQTDILCFWCKHSFTTRPLGCPIKFINNRIEKAYVSQITKDKYFMKENVTLQKLADITGKKIYNTSSTEIKTIEKEHYITDGIFCSFNCIMAFVVDHSHDSLYNESKMLTYTMYKQLVGKDVVKIKSAPHWRLLKSFGGQFSIEKFRETFNIFEYEECSFHMKTLSKIFKEK
jgi:hypothetical protein